MLTELVLENWKSYEQARVSIDALTVLIGTNASGKSNALDAFAFLNRVANGATLTASLQGDGVLPALRGGVDWAARRPNAAFAVGVTCRADEQTDYLYKLECVLSDNRCEVLSEQLTRVRYRLDRNGQRKRDSVLSQIKLFRTDVCDASSPTVTARLYNEKQGSPRVVSRVHSVLTHLSGQKLRQEIQEGVGVVTGLLRDIFILDPIPSHMRGYSPLSEKLDSDARNIAGVIAALPEEKQRSIESVLTRYARKLPEKDIRRVYAEPVGKFKSDAMLYCEEQWKDSGDPPTVDARGMSDGTLRFLAILTALLTRPRHSLLVIEEVDNGLHPSRARMLLDMLQEVGAEQRVDVLVTTHNPALLDAMGAAMVPFITVAHRDPRSGISKLTLLEDMTKLPKLLAQGSIGKLSSSGVIEKALQMEFDFPRSNQGGGRSMTRRVLVLDTSVLCCWLQIPGKEIAGPDSDRWDYDRISNLLEKERLSGSFFVLPLATLIETGNHVAQSNGDRFSLACALAECMCNAVEAASPWAAFTDQSPLWDGENMRRLAEMWPKLAAQRITIGDATIKDVAEHYAQAGFDVEILTGDAGLKAHQPVCSPRVPRRRR